LQTSQGYIIRILQHFATKLWNITNFVMLFQAVMKFLSRLVEFKIWVNWGMVHCYHIWAENGSNFRTQYKSIQNLQTLQGLYFPHFTTKLCNFTHFSMLFLAAVISLHLLA
jgi:hypothetical protein